MQYVISKHGMDLFLNLPIKQGVDVWFFRVPVARAEYRSPTGSF